MYQYLARFIRAKDGDTIEADIELGFYVTTRATLRFAGIDTPPLNTLIGQLAWVEVNRALSEAARICIKSLGSDKYGRYISEIWYTNDPAADPSTAPAAPWLDLCAHLVKKGLASWKMS